jgi:hypothetical protein
MRSEPSIGQNNIPEVCDMLVLRKKNDGVMNVVYCIIISIVDYTTGTTVVVYWYCIV